MDDIFGLEKYNNIERVLKLENELYRPFWDIIASQQARYESLTEMVNKNLYINQTVAMLSERMDKKIEKYQKLFESSNLEMLNYIAEYQDRIYNRYLSMSDAIQNTFSLSNDSIYKYSELISSIADNHFLEQCVDKMECHEEKSEVSSEEIDEVYNDLATVAEDSQNWQQRLVEVVTSWKNKNPVIFFILVSVILPIILSIVASPISNAFTQNDTRIKDDPSASGNTICNVSVNQEITIISTTTNYYYEVEFYDEESGKFIKGWISKRSVKLVDGSSECKTSEDGSEEMEAE